MLKPVAVASLLVAVTSSAFADTETTTADTLVVVTPNAPVVVTQGAPSVTQPVAAPGAAEMPPPPVPRAAPQNEDWNNVSHINGVPVKVGERHEYLYKPKTYNIAGNPFGLFFGYYDVAASMALGNHLAATIAVSGWDFEYRNGYQISATLPLYFRKTFSGPFLEAGLLIRGTEKEYEAYPLGYCADSCSSSTDSWAGPQLLFGWHWTFDSGLNTSFAFGLAKRMEGGDNDTDGNVYWRVGYAF